MLKDVFASYPYGVRAAIVAAIVLVVAYFIAELVSRVLVLLVERIDRRTPGDLTQRKSTRAALRLVRHASRARKPPAQRRFRNGRSTSPRTSLPAAR